MCLGHQAIGQAFGGKVVRAQAAHARQDVARSRHDGSGVFAACRTRFAATRYHSLAIERESLPDGLAVTARTGRRRDHGRAAPRASPVEGVQFHPESILTEHGHALLENFLEAAR